MEKQLGTVPKWLKTPKNGWEPWKNNWETRLNGWEP